MEFLKKLDKKLKDIDAKIQGKSKEARGKVGDLGISRGFSKFGDELNKGLSKVEQGVHSTGIGEKFDKSVKNADLEAKFKDVLKGPKAKKKDAPVKDESPAPAATKTVKKTVKKTTKKVVKKTAKKSGKLPSPVA